MVVALHLTGSADDSLGWLSQRLDTSAGTTPLGGPTGNSSLAAVDVMPWCAWLAAAAALLTAARVRQVSRVTVRSDR